MVNVPTRQPEELIEALGAPAFPRHSLHLIAELLEEQGMEEHLDVVRTMFAEGLLSYQKHAIALSTSIVEGEGQQSFEKAAGQVKLVADTDTQLAMFEVVEESMLEVQLWGEEDGAQQPLNEGNPAYIIDPIDGSIHFKWMYVNRDQRPRPEYGDRSKVGMMWTYFDGSDVAFSIVLAPETGDVWIGNGEATYHNGQKVKPTAVFDMDEAPTLYVNQAGDEHRTQEVIDFIAFFEAQGGHVVREPSGSVFVLQHLGEDNVLILHEDHAFEEQLEEGTLWTTKRALCDTAVDEVMSRGVGWAMHYLDSGERRPFQVAANNTEAKPYLMGSAAALRWASETRSQWKTAA